MPTKPSILAFAGSTRTASYNKLMIRYAAKVAEEEGAQVTLVDLRDYPMPLYDGDLEASSGLPENALKFVDLMKAHQGFLINCPEYNSAITAVLKNTIDWVSRRQPDDPPLVAFRNKTAGLLAATPGSLGGIRTLVSVRTILGNLNVYVIPQQYGLAQAAGAFDEDGMLIDETARSRVRAVVKQLVEVTRRLNA